MIIFACIFVIFGIFIAGFICGTIYQRYIFEQWEIEIEGLERDANDSGSNAATMRGATHNNIQEISASASPDNPQGHSECGEKNTGRIIGIL
jgi:hypothetical protein